MYHRYSKLVLCATLYNQTDIINHIECIDKFLSSKDTSFDHIGNTDAFRTFVPGAWQLGWHWSVCSESLTDV